VKKKLVERVGLNRSDKRKDDNKELSKKQRIALLRKDGKLMRRKGGKIRNVGIKERMRVHHEQPGWSGRSKKTNHRSGNHGERIR